MEDKLIDIEFPGAPPEILKQIYAETPAKKIKKPIDVEKIKRIIRQILFGIFCIGLPIFIFVAQFFLINHDDGNSTWFTLWNLPIIFGMVDFFAAMVVDILLGMGILYGIYYLLKPSSGEK